MGMKRIQIQLPDDEFGKLKNAAAREHRSIADCIREGIRLFLGRSRTAEGDLEEIAGKFRPQLVKDLKPHDRWLVESILSRPKR